MNPPILVYDLEFTAWPGSRERRWQGPGEHREIVQIGAVKLDGASLLEIGVFNRLVRPRINPQLSSYFVELTGITQVALERQGVDFPAALTQFAAFSDGAAALLSNGPDQHVIFENCSLAGCPCPIEEHRFRNIGPALARAAGRLGHVSSGSLPDAFPGIPSLPAHNALADARMVAAALALVRGDVLGECRDL